MKRIILVVIITVIVTVLTTTIAITTGAAKTDAANLIKEDYSGRGVPHKLKLIEEHLENGDFEELGVHAAYSAEVVDTMINLIDETGDYERITATVADHQVDVNLILIRQNTEIIRLLRKIANE